MAIAAPPPARMRPNVRIAITLLFVVTFFVTAPIVLLVTSGYRYNWKRQRIQKTGIIQVETQPQDAHVRLDGVPQRKTTPAMFPRLLPQDYRVTVEKDGYLPWEKTLEVRSGETAFATGIVLYKEALPRLVIDADILAAAWNADGTDVAYVARTGELAEISVSIDGTAPRLLARVAQSAYAQPRLAWSPAGDAVLLVAAAGSATHAIIYGIDDVDEPVTVHESFPKGALTVRWSDGGDRVAVTSADGAFAVNAADGTVTPVLLDADIQDLALRGRTAYVLRERRDADGRPEVALETSAGVPVTDKPFQPGAYRFLDADGKRLLVADDRRGRLHVTDPSSGATETVEATGATWSADGRRLLAWNDFEISVIGADGRAELVTRLGSTITRCEWSPEGDAVIVGGHAGITLVELDGRDRRNTHELIRFTDVGAFAVDPAANALRFVGTAGNRRGTYERDL